jgi:PGM1 C-terminal domain
MLDNRSALGSLVHTPSGPRKSGIPESVEMPAPVRATTRSDCLIHRATSGRSVVAWLIRMSVPYGAVSVASFEDLQRKFDARFADKGFGAIESGTMVVLPSITFPTVELRKISGIVFYEERLLCLALLLRNEGLRIVYVTSMPVDKAIVEYYLRWLPDVSSGRDRLAFVELGDPEPRALTEKLRDNPQALDLLKERIGDDTDAFIVPFNMTSHERWTAEALGIPVYGINPDQVALGTKTGSRLIAREAGVPVLPGAEDLHSAADVEEAIIALRADKPSVRSVVVKLNNGFSGQGNAIIDMAHLSSPIQDTPTTFCAQTETWATYTDKIASEGAVVEALAQEPGTVSPSVQLRVGPHGEIEVLSTHDQILGGPDDQVYLGCRFPAQRRYRKAIRDAGLKVAALLAQHGIIGPFGIDFVVPPGDGEPEVFLSEINLRMGGTTHPMIMARNLTRARYDSVSDELMAANKPVHYVASDNIKSPAYVGMTPQDAIDAVDDAGLAFDPLTNTGAVLHLLGAIREHGKLGSLCLANSHAQAQDLYGSVIEALDDASAHRR